MKKPISKTACLLAVDIQNDFCPGGSLAIREADQIIPIINSLAPLFAIQVATQDWHPLGHISFASNHEERKAFEIITINGRKQELWPDHCVQGTRGADFHPQLDLRPYKLIIRKGYHPLLDSYSAFFENDRITQTGLDGFLQDLGVKHVYLAGLATDYCVLYSAIDALALGYAVTVIQDACRGVDFPEGSVKEAMSLMKEKGVSVIPAQDLI